MSNEGESKDRVERSVRQFRALQRKGQERVRREQGVVAHRHDAKPDKPPLRDQATLTRRQLLYPNGIPAEPLLKEYAEHLGHVVLMAANVDLILNVIGHELAQEGIIKTGAWGASGRPLVDLLRHVGPDHPTVLDLAARYESLYLQRNQLIHSIRPVTKGPEAFSPTVRLRRYKGTGEISDMPTTLEHISVEELEQAFFDWQDLHQAAVLTRKHRRAGKH